VLLEDCQERLLNNVFGGSIVAKREPCMTHQTLTQLSELSVDRLRRRCLVYRGLRGIPQTLAVVLQLDHADSSLVVSLLKRWKGADVEATLSWRLSRWDTSTDLTN
jgi:hypothetical protein